MAPSFGWAVAVVSVALGALGSVAGAVALPIVGRLAVGLGPGLAFYAGIALCAVGVAAATKASSRHGA